METGDNKSEYRADNVDTDEREHKQTVLERANNSGHGGGAAAVARGEAARVPHGCCSKMLKACLDWR